MKRLQFLLLLLVPTKAEAYANLVGNKDVLAFQNTIADQEGLHRVRSLSDLEVLKKNNKLVPLSGHSIYTIDKNLPVEYRWCRPEAMTFLVNIASNFKKHFGHLLQVNSAVRTQVHQRELQRINKNAAGIERGPNQSLHLTGAAIDIAKIGMSVRERTWMQFELLKLESQGTIEATEEFSKQVFHIMVFTTPRHVTFPKSHRSVKKGKHSKKATVTHKKHSKHKN